MKTLLMRRAKFCAHRALNASLNGDTKAYKFWHVMGHTYVEMYTQLPVIRGAIKTRAEA